MLKKTLLLSIGISASALAGNEQGGFGGKSSIQLPSEVFAEGLSEVIVDINDLPSFRRANARLSIHNTASLQLQGETLVVKRLEKSVVDLDEKRVFIPIDASVISDQQAQ
jgi:hypothetical protein